MSSLCLARLVPIGEPATVRGGSGQPVTFTFDKFHFSDTRSILRNGGDIPVLLGHDETMRIGTLRSLNPNRSWWVVDFELDDALGVKFDVGQNVSIGLGWLLNDAGNPRVNEVSVVRRGRIAGAEIIARQERKATAPTPARVDSAREVTFGHGQMIRRPNIGKVMAVEGRPVGRSAVSARAASLTRALQAMPDDGFCTTYDEYGNEISRTRIAWR